MHSANLKIPKRYQSEWILSKIKNFLKNDPYLKNADWKPLYQVLEHCIYTAESLEEALDHFGNYDFKQALEFSRKTDSSGVMQRYVIPNLKFQIQSIVDCWDCISLKYRELEPLEKGRHFGHRPDTNTYLPYQGLRETAKNLDLALNSPLKIKYQLQYNCFKQAVLGFAKKSVDKNNEAARAFLVQTDIKGFFYSVSLPSLAKAIDLYAPDLMPCKRYINQLETQGHDHLPIGWVLSGIIVDRLLAEFHRKVDGKLRMAAAKFSHRKLKYVSAANYVDDFFFSYSITISKTDLLSDEYKQNEKQICSELVEIINSLINEIFCTSTLEFYPHGSEKFQTLYFNYRNVDLLETNFHALMHEGNYNDESEMGTLAELDERMLPADNDLVLNEKAYFNVLLRNIKKRVIDGGIVEHSEFDDLFKKIIIKISGAEKKYIINVVELLELLAFTNREKFLDSSILKINDLYNTLVENSTPFDIWLKYFNRLFVFYTRSGFNKRVPFIRQFTDFERHWLASEKKSKDDWLLLKSMYQEVCFKAHLERNGTAIFGRVKNIKGGILSPYELRGRKLYVSSAQGPNVEFATFATNAKTSLLRIKSHNERLTIVLSILAEIPDKSLRFHFLSIVASSIGLDNFDDFDGFLKKIKPQIILRDWNRINNVFLFAKRIRRLSSYLQKLEYIERQLLLDKKLMPRIDQANKSRSYVKFLADCFIVLCCHEHKDMINAVLSISKPGRNGRLLDRTSMPTTLKGIGLGFYEALRTLSTHHVNVKTGELTSPKRFKEDLDRLIKVEKGFYKSNSALEQFKNSDVCKIDIDSWMSYEKKYFKAGKWNITLSPLGIRESDYDPTDGLSFFADSVERINIQVHTSINEASKRSSTMLVFPELSVPRKYLFGYIRTVTQKKMILIGGLEYQHDSTKFASNSTIICIPVEKNEDPFSRSFLCFEQLKHYPAAVEQAQLMAKKFRYKSGDNTYLFNSRKIGNFANLTCSDFLSLRLRLKVQERVHFLVVPAQNPDNSTYDHLAQSCIRDLHCFSVICNSQLIGTSLIYGPYYDQSKRTLLKREGVSNPEFATISWSPLILKLSQKADSQIPFRKKRKNRRKRTGHNVSDFKQTPPDWGY